MSRAKFDRNKYAKYYSKSKKDNAIRHYVPDRNQVIEVKPQGIGIFYNDSLSKAINNYIS